MLPRLFAYLLVAVHAGLAVWATVGFIEWFVPEPPWKRLSNPELPRPMQLLQWTLLAIAAAVFIGGFVTRWRHTPLALTATYVAMASTCAWQTFTMLTHASRYRDMAIEYAEYALILAFVYGSAYMRERFAATPAAT